VFESKNQHKPHYLINKQAITITQRIDESATETIMIEMSSDTANT